MRSPAGSGALSSAGPWVKGRSASWSRTAPPGTGQRWSCSPRAQGSQTAARTAASDRSHKHFSSQWQRLTDAVTGVHSDEGALETTESALPLC